MAQTVRNEHTLLAVSMEQRKALLRPVNLPRPMAALIALVFVAVVAWSLAGVKVSVHKFVHGIPLFADFFRDMWPPDWGQFGTMWPPVRARLQVSFSVKSAT